MATVITDSLYNDNIHTVTAQPSKQQTLQQIIVPTHFTSKSIIQISLKQYNTQSFELYNNSDKLCSIVYKSCGKQTFTLDCLNTTTHKELVLQPYQTHCVTITHTPNDTEYGKRIECMFVLQWLKYTIKLRIDRNVPVKGSKQLLRRPSVQQSLDTDNKENQPTTVNKRSSNKHSSVIDMSTVKSKVNSFPQQKPALSRLPSREERVANNNGAWSRRTSVTEETTVNKMHTERVVQNWAVKQEIGFTKWLNHILLNGTSTSNNNGISELLHTKSMSSVYERGCTIVRDMDMNGCISKIRNDIENDKISLKSDILTAYSIDTVKKQLVSAICKLLTTDYIKFIVECMTELQYDSNIACEQLVAMYMFDSAALHSIACSRVSDKLLFSPTKPIQQKRTNTVYNEQQRNELLRSVLLKCIQFVLVADQLKSADILPHKPLLFATTNTIVTTTQQLLTTLTSILCSETTLYQRLQRYGYILSYVQKPIETIDMCITCLAVDLRDGVRLCKVIDMLLQQHNNTVSLIEQLYLPSNTYDKKVHNVNLALTTLQQYYPSMPLIRADDIVQGNQSKTLALVGYIIMNYDINQVLDGKLLQTEIERIMRYRATELYKHSNNSVMYIASNSEKLQLLLQWIQLICTLSKQNINVQNFNTSFTNGVALCLLINYYYPTLIRKTDITYPQHDMESIVDTTTVTTDDIKNYRFETNFATITHIEPTYNERMGRHNYELFNSAIQQLGQIPVMLKYDSIQDEKLIIVFLIYLCQRLLVLSHEIHAVTVIQRLYRRKFKKCIIDDSVDISTQIHSTALNTSILPALNTSLHNITEHSVGLLELSTHSDHNTNLHNSSIHNDTQYTTDDITAQLLHQHQQRQLNAAIILQSYTRRYNAQRQLQQLKTIALIEQKRQEFINNAAIKIQSIFRRKLAQNTVSELIQQREAEQAEYERQEYERMESDRMAAEHAVEQQRVALEQLRIEAEQQAEIERILVAEEVARIEAQLAAEREQERIAAELEQQRIEKIRVAAEQAEMERVQRIENQRIAAERAAYEAEQQRLAAEQAEQVRIAEQQAMLLQQQQQTERMLAEQAEQQRQAELQQLQGELEHTAATCIQSWIRTHIQRQQYKQLVHSAIVLQSAWRGKQLRDKSQHKIVHIREKLKNVTTKLDEHMRIGQRTKSAVELLLSSKSLTIVNQACITLEVVTKLLPVCCTDAVEQGTVSILYDLLQTCNHSQPHLILIDIVLKVLINIANNSSTRIAVLGHNNAVSILMKQLQYIKASESILINVLTLLNMSLQYNKQTTKTAVATYWESQIERKIAGIEAQLQRELEKCNKAVTQKSNVQISEKLKQCISMLNKFKTLLV